MAVFRIEDLGSLPNALIKLGSFQNYKALDRLVFQAPFTTAAYVRSVLLRYNAVDPDEKPAVDLVNIDYSFFYRPVKNIISDPFPFDRLSG